MKTVRDGQKVWPYCSDCGCRLEIHHAFQYTDQHHILYTHYGGDQDRDSRGHTCKSVDKLWISSPKLIAHIGV